MEPQKIALLSSGRGPRALWERSCTRSVPAGWLGPRGQRAGHLGEQPSPEVGLGCWGLVKAGSEIHSLAPSSATPSSVGGQPHPILHLSGPEGPSPPRTLPGPRHSLKSLLTPPPPRKQSSQRRRWSQPENVRGGSRSPWGRGRHLAPYARWPTGEAGLARGRCNANRCPACGPESP